MRVITILTIAALTLSLMLGCAAIDKGAMTRMIPMEHSMEADTFMYVSLAGLFYEPDSPRAEAIRISWLEEILEANGYVGRPYTILTREVVTKPFALANGYEVYYLVRVER